MLLGVAACQLEGVAVFPGMPVFSYAVQHDKGIGNSW